MIFTALAATAAVGRSNSSDFRLISVKSETLTQRAMIRARASVKGLIGKDKRSVTFDARSVRLVVTTGPSNDMMSFRIRSLRNPTIFVRVSAKLHVLFVNTDGDMMHSFGVTSKTGPFEAKVVGQIVGSANVKHTAGSRYFAQDLLFTAPSKPGSYSYVCSTPGHAAAGMFGTLIVR